MARTLLCCLALLFILLGCAVNSVGPTSLPTEMPPAATARPSPGGATVGGPTTTPVPGGLSQDQVATLESLRQGDAYPLYTMHYRGAYESVASSQDGAGPLADTVHPAALPAWSCSLFAALADAEGMHYGRNFDWEYSPALLLFTDPPDGYASVSMVDIAYLIGPDSVAHLAELPLEQRRSLLRAPFWPFDGMNEHGLVVGMAAVSDSRPPYDPHKASMDSLGIIREMLDHARDVDEAVGLVQQYNLRWEGGPPLHYLIADASGRAVLLEFIEGEMVVLPQAEPWHLATNHLRALAEETGAWSCWRYDHLLQRLSEAGGRLSRGDALALLQQVAQPGTQWSVVYGISSGEVTVAMGRAYDRAHVFRLDRVGE